MLSKKQRSQAVFKQIRYLGIWWSRGFL
jgi:hypothetical protein